MAENHSEMARFAIFPFPFASVYLVLTAQRRFPFVLILTNSEESERAFPSLCVCAFFLYIVAPAVLMTDLVIMWCHFRCLHCSESKRRSLQSKPVY